MTFAQDGTCPSLSLLRGLRRECAYYGITFDQVTTDKQKEVMYIMGGECPSSFVCTKLSSLERRDSLSDSWVTLAPLNTARCSFGVCIVAGELCVIGGEGDYSNNGFVKLSSMEMYNTTENVWKFLKP